MLDNAKDLGSSQLPKDGKTDTLDLSERDIRKSLQKRPGGQLDKFDSSKKQLFLKYLSTLYPNIWKACALVGVHKSTVMAHMQKDLVFAQACADIADRVMDEVEGHMQTFAATPKGFLDRIAILKANRPEKWDQARKIEMTHKRAGEDQAGVDARRSVLTRIVAEDTDVIEAVTGKHLDALPARPEDIPPDLEAIDPDNVPVDSTIPPTVIEDLSKIIPPSVTPSEDGGLDNRADLPHSYGMTRLNPFDLGMKSPPRKTKRVEPVPTPPPPPVGRSGKRGK